MRRAFGYRGSALMLAESTMWVQRDGSSLYFDHYRGPYNHLSILSHALARATSTLKTSSFLSQVNGALQHTAGESYPSLLRHRYRWTLGWRLGPVRASEVRASEQEMGWLDRGKKHEVDKSTWYSTKISCTGAELFCLLQNISQVFVCMLHGDTRDYVVWRHLCLRVWLREQVVNENDPDQERG